jgi:formate hydrogenlyase subunit 3/multisubunit Na+/H+ antiporter MnhD subunit
MSALFAAAAPLLIAWLLLKRDWAPLVLRRLLPLAPVPALLLALFGDPQGSTAFRSLLLGTELGLRHSGPGFLFFTSLIWLVSGWYAARYQPVEASKRAFSFFWLLTLTGNLGLVLAGDVPSFYAFFAVMTFSGTGLVLHTGTPEARRAGLVYVIMAVAAEAMLIAAFLLAVASAQSLLLADAAAGVALSPRRDLIVALTLLGFGVKAGLVPLHFWLPLAHPVAPTPASAVLSGAMIKAGLLGWIHLLPGGLTALEQWGVLMILAGLVSAVYAVFCGLWQSDGKTVLAYSSVSQMGVMLMALGAGLAVPEAWPAAILAVGLYALNHGLSKAALFLGVDASLAFVGAARGRRLLFMAALALPAAAIAGAPVTGGVLAKASVERVLGEAPDGISFLLTVLFPVLSVASTLLLGHFLVLIWKRLSLQPSPESSRLLRPWLLSAAAAVLALRIAVVHYALEVEPVAMTLSELWSKLWPIFAGTAILAVGWKLPVSWRRARVPPGDVVVLLEKAAAGAGRWMQPLTRPELLRINVMPFLERLVRSGQLQDALDRGEKFLQRPLSAGVLMLTLFLLLWWLSRA